MRTNELVPVAAGLFEGTGNSAHLIGTRCTSCGSHYCPKTLSCRNPQCLEKATQDMLLYVFTGVFFLFTLDTFVLLGKSMRKGKKSA